MGKWEYLGLGLKQKQSQRHILPKCKQKSYIYRKQQQINSASLSTGEDQVVLAVGELERVHALTVTSPVRCSLIIPDHERRALFCYPITSLAIFRCPVDYGVS